MTYSEKDLSAIEEAIVKLQNGERITSVTYAVSVLAFQGFGRLRASEIRALF